MVISGGKWVVQAVPRGTLHLDESVTHKRAHPPPRGAAAPHASGLLDARQERNETHAL
jgi:hypothetical protein